MEQILLEVPQGLVLRPILCNMFLSDLSLNLNDIDMVSYADDNILYKAFGNIDAVVEGLRISTKKLFKVKIQLPIKTCFICFDESPLKMTIFFISSEKLFSFSRY